MSLSSSPAVLTFRTIDAAAPAKPTPAKAALKVRQSVAHSKALLTALGERNPDAAFLIESDILDWLTPAPPVRAAPRRPLSVPRPRPASMSRAMLPACGYGPVT